jgi:hypothetical protein
MVPFRLAIAPEIACFIGFFGNWPPFLRILENRPPKWTLFNARLTKMRCGAHRPGCDFGRTFAHHFGVVFGLVFEYFFWPRWRDDLPVYRCFLDLRCWLGPLFRPVLGRTFVPVFRHFQTRTCSLSYKNCLDVCLPIANKTAHPVRVRLVGKRRKPEKLDFSNRRCLSTGPVLASSWPAFTLWFIVHAQQHPLAPTNM